MEADDWNGYGMQDGCEIMHPLIPLNIVFETSSSEDWNFERPPVVAYRAGGGLCMFLRVDSCSYSRRILLVWLLSISDSEYLAPK